MATDKNEAVNLWPYVGIYILTQVILYLLWVGFVYFVPSVSKGVNSSASFAIIFSGIVLDYLIFIKKNRRIFYRGEYWRMVFSSTAAALLFSAACLLVSVTLGLVPGVTGIPAGVWIMVFVILAIFSFCINAAGFSNRVGKSLLKTNRARQIQVDTEPFR